MGNSDTSDALKILLIHPETYVCGTINREVVNQKRNDFWHLNGKTNSETINLNT